MKQPPIGVKPRWLVVEARLHDLADAIKRYESAGELPLIEWYEEFYELEYWLKMRRLKNLQ